MARKLKHAGALIPLLALLAGCATAPTAKLAATVDRQQQADRAYVEGHLAQALAGYQSLTHTQPQHAEFWFRLGNTYARLQRPDEALDAYQHVLRIEPRHAKAWYNLGIIRLREAEAAFDQGAQAAAGIDAGLQQDSAGKARAIAAMRRASDPDATATTGPTAPATDGATVGAAEARP